MQQKKDQLSFYKYTPKKGASFIFVVLFIVVTVALVIQMFVARYKTEKQFQRLDNSDDNHVIPKGQNEKMWSVTVGIHVPLIVCGVLETAGYIARCVSANDVHAAGSYAAQAVLIIVAPCFVSGTLYMQFYNTVEFLNCPSTSKISFFLRNSMMFQLFVASDVISFVLQGVGAGLTSLPSAQGTGRSLMFLGLIIHLISSEIFLFNQINFYKHHSKYSVSEYCNTIDKKWLILNGCMIGSTICIVIRTIVRIIACVRGQNGFISRHEVFLFVFDALVMLISMALLTVPFRFVHLGTLYLWYCSFRKETLQSLYKLDESDEEFEIAIL